MRRSGRRRVEAEAAVADQPDAAVEDLEAAAGESEADGGEDAVAVGASVRARAMNGLSREHRRREGGAAGVGRSRRAGRAARADGGRAGSPQGPGGPDESASAPPTAVSCTGRSTPGRGSPAPALVLVHQYKGRPYEWTRRSRTSTRQATRSSTTPLARPSKTMRTSWPGTCAGDRRASLPSRCGRGERHQDRAAPHRAPVAAHRPSDAALIFPCTRRSTVVGLPVLAASRLWPSRASSRARARAAIRPAPLVRLAAAPRGSQRDLRRPAARP